MRPSVSSSPVALSASEGLTGCSGIVRTTVSRHIFWGRYSLGIELEGLLGWKIHMEMPWSPLPLLYYQTQLELWPFTLRDGHRVGSKVG